MSKNKKNSNKMHQLKVAHAVYKIYAYMRQFMNPKMSFVRIAKVPITTRLAHSNCSINLHCLIFWFGGSRASGKH